MNNNAWFKPAFVRAALVAGGLFYLLTSLALLFAPRWFFDNIGPFPPFNRHYEGDLGGFLLPLAIGLLWAARDPLRQRGIVGLVLVGTWAHTVNHIYGDLVLDELTTSQLAADLVPLIIFALALTLAYVWNRPAAAQKVSQSRRLQTQS